MLNLSVGDEVVLCGDWSGDNPVVFETISKVSKTRFTAGGQQFSIDLSVNSGQVYRAYGACDKYASARLERLDDKAKIEARGKAVRLENERREIRFKLLAASRRIQSGIHNWLTSDQEAAIVKALESLEIPELFENRY